ncbi:hypothetical protein QMK38_13150 [Lysinibacillus fusiformis]|nr:hypothetical protein [Lysinibacillus fusiformis]
MSKRFLGLFSFAAETGQQNFMAKEKRRNAINLTFLRLFISGSATSPD